mmetsp:Transcript_28592/g.42279  ORF Transcript_28592/g.42279 Transcript_28592/m.42279 type:complete len:275 (-) Transcript_28592:55-879(-)|eukprot:CAMPEP_0195519128 /NCGR_PEP_ID=MMETSP0794_2-20130614/14423_1 /TAXON_ID=515487 /ORGANISM="Stephanopyxis turris, Strain CCMP 815" /LENGTH=274 /DNA_ID=CAMNT_0040648235 /DNA_START=142 /DNA_END=966 /DNA_ORIENTATION=+
MKFAAGTVLTSLLATTSHAIQTSTPLGACRILLSAAPYPCSQRFATSRKASSAAVEESTNFWQTRSDCWRPTVSDVERISFGKPAKKKGTGSRGVPHRLNQEERKLFDQARRKGFLEVGGSGWRKQRADAPLLNTYRSLCDARGQACIVLHKGNTGIDDLTVDLSPLRFPGMFQTVAESCGCSVGIPPNVVGNEDSEVANDTEEGDEGDPYETQPIYHLPPFYMVWEMERSDAKLMGKNLATTFQTIEKNAAKSKKPVGVKPGKSRRHGGYGIG